MDISKAMDEVWDRCLNRLCGKGEDIVRGNLGSNIDLFVPQARTTLLLQANPALSTLIYSSAYAMGNRDAYMVVRKLGMPADYFWKFSYWSRGRAFDALGKIITRIFSGMMKQNKEGELTLVAVDPERDRYELVLRDCAECAGIEAQSPVCCYHAGLLAGIISALINKDMASYEKTCLAKGDESCLFCIGARDDEELAIANFHYLGRVRLEHDVLHRLMSNIEALPVRQPGWMVDIAYNQLVLLASLAADPGLISTSSFEVGSEWGARLASVIRKLYRGETLEAIKQYYSQLHHLQISSIAMEPNPSVRISEMAETTGIEKESIILSFTAGELTGLLSSLTGQRLYYGECKFEGDDIVITFSRQA